MPEKCYFKPNRTKIRRYTPDDLTRITRYVCFFYGVNETQEAIYNASEDGKNYPGCDLCDDICDELWEEILEDLVDNSRRILKVLKLLQRLLGNAAIRLLLRRIPQALVLLEALEFALEQAGVEDMEAVADLAEGGLLPRFKRLMARMRR